MIGASHHFLRAFMKSHIIAVFDLAILNPREKFDCSRVFQLLGDVNRTSWPTGRVAEGEAKLTLFILKGLILPTTTVYKLLDVLAKYALPDGPSLAINPLGKILGREFSC